MNMTREEAIKFATHAQSMTDLPEVKEFYAMAEAALRARGPMCEFYENGFCVPHS